MSYGTSWIDDPLDLLGIRYDAELERRARLEAEAEEDEEDE